MIAKMDDLSYQVPFAPPGFKPRTGRLIAAGILLLLAGCACGCMTAATPLALLNPQINASAQGRQLLTGGLLYLAITIALFTLATGALLPRRWCRPLVLILSTHWLIIGVFSALGSLLFIPVIKDLLAQQGAGPPPGYLIVSFIFGGLFMIVAFIGWPLALLLLMRGEDMRRTCEWRDPVPRWTDGRPINILGLSLTLLLAAFFSLYAGFQPALPILGVVLHGPVAIVVAAAVAAVLGVAAVRVYRLEFAGWWMGLLGVILPILAYVPNGWLVSLKDLYSAGGLQPAQVEPFLRHETAMRASMIAFPLIFAAAFAIYMIRLRPAFIAAASERSRGAAV